MRLQVVVRIASTSGVAAAGLCQIAHPGWYIIADGDPEQVIQTRRTVLDRFASSPVLVIVTRFVGATAGRIVRDGDACWLDV